MSILANDFFQYTAGTTVLPAGLPPGAFAPLITVYYGGGVTTPGHLHYLNSGTGNWTLANATAVASGEDEDLAIAMGATPAAGMMLRGWYNILAADLNGAWANGGDLWMDVNAGHFATNAAVPAVAGNVRRILGAGTNVANVFLFQPDGAWAVVA